MKHIIITVPTVPGFRFTNLQKSLETLCYELLEINSTYSSSTEPDRELKAARKVAEEWIKGMLCHSRLKISDNVFAKGFSILYNDAKIMNVCIASIKVDLVGVIEPKVSLIPKELKSKFKA